MLSNTDLTGATLEERQQHDARVRKLSDAELRCMVVLRSSDYVAVLVELAREEMLRRRLSIPSHFEYARDFPEEWAAAVGLCYRCWEQTTDESPGDMVTINVLFGTRFLNAGDPCPYCGSLVQTKWFCILFPIVLLGRYRVRNLGNDQYVGRKLKELVA